MASRMSLTNVRAGVIKAPLRELLYGPEGIGKSTFGADAPTPIFLAGEAGTNRLSVARFPAPGHWREVLEAIEVLTQEKHDYQTLVVDTLDWLEPLLLASVCETARVRNIDDVGGGYGKGYVQAVTVWRDFLGRLERMQAKRGLHVILLAHAQLKTFRNPEGDDFDRYSLKLNEKASAVVREWAESVLFANHEIEVRKDRNKRVRGTSSGARWLYTTRAAAYDAKNRYGLPSRLPLDFADFFARWGSSQSDDPASIRSAVLEAAAKLPEDVQVKVRESLTGAGEDVRLLAKIRNRVQARLEEIETPAPAEATT